MTEKLLQDLLADAPVFCRLDEIQMKSIKQSAIKRHLQAGEYIAHYGDLWPCVFVVATGIISAQKLSPEGRVMGALRLTAGHFFWSPTIFDDGPLPASLEVREDCSVYLWAREDVLPFVKLNHAALWDLCSLLMKRIRQASEIVEDLAFQTVSGRLAGLLIKQYQEKADSHIPRTLTLEEMAGMISTTPVMVCKILSHFAAEGLISVKRTEFEMVDPKMLGRIAGYD